MDFLSNKTILDNIMLYGQHFFSALVIASAGYFIAKKIRCRLRDFFKHRSTDVTAQLFLINAIYTLVLLVITIIALAQLGLPTASLLTVLGAGSLAIGLSIKDSLSNIASGLLIIFLKPFRLGDLVEINKTSGTVREIGLFTTQITSGNHENIVIPNSKVMAGRMVNKAHKGTRRIDLSIGISYDSDIKKAKSIIQLLISDDTRVLLDPAPSIVVKDLADSAVILAVRPWVRKENYGKVVCDLLENIKLKFDEAGIVIPFPQLNVSLKNELEK